MRSSSISLQPTLCSSPLPMDYSVPMTLSQSRSSGTPYPQNELATAATYKAHTHLAVQSDCPAPAEKIHLAAAALAAEPWPRPGLQDRRPSCHPCSCYNPALPDQCNCPRCSLCPLVETCQVEDCTFHCKCLRLRASSYLCISENE